MNKARLFLIILIEGYAVLATELLAIRQLIPFVGSGTDTVAILISAVLLPLAIGYHQGGRCRLHIRQRLLRNILIALVILTLGLSRLFLDLFFDILANLGLTRQVVQTAIYAVIFLSPPVFLLGQTVPLVSNYFGRARLSEITGRMLFFSTIGSFLGSVFSTLVLMNTIGVHYTVVVTLTLLALLVPLMARRVFSRATAGAALLVVLVVQLNNSDVMRRLEIVSDNSYNVLSVHEDPKTGDRHLSVNRSTSSGIGKNGERIYPYIAYIERIFIDPISKPGMKPREILVLGAGGFTVGLEDTVNHYTFVDIDPDLKAASETYFLKKPLGPNKTFVPVSARAFVRRAQEKYDFIMIDTFTHIFAVPMETTTVEFLQGVKKLLKPGGIVLVNQAASADFDDRFSARYDRVFADVFPRYTRQIVGDYNPWAPPRPHGLRTNDTSRLNNVLYIYYDRAYNDDTVRYRDDLNTYALDRY